MIISNYFYVILNLFLVLFHRLTHKYIHLNENIQRKEKQMKVITLANQKGGCGKTTTSHTLAAGLHNRGYKVLAIDCDPQCNFSTVFGLMPPQGSFTLYDVLSQQISISEAKVTAPAGPDVILGDLMLCGADRKFITVGDRKSVV